MYFPSAQAKRFFACRGAKSAPRKVERGGVAGMSMQEGKSGGEGGCRGGSRAAVLAAAAIRGSALAQQRGHRALFAVAEVNLNGFGDLGGIVRLQGIDDGQVLLDDLVDRLLVHGL